MDKDFDFGALAAGMDFIVDGDAAWGRVGSRSYGLRVDGVTGALLVAAAVDGRDEASRLTLDAWLAERKASGTIASFTDAEGNLSLTVPRAAAEGLKAFLGELSAAMDAASLSPACWDCRTAVGTEGWLVGGQPIPLCGVCASKREEASLAAAAQRTMDLPSILRGAVGALVGALVGSVVWVLIGYFGYVASVAGFVMALTAIGGYGLLKGKMNIAAPITVGVSVLIAVFAAQAAVLVVFIMKAFGGEGSSISVMRAITLLPLVLMEPSVRSDTIMNLGLGILFAALGSWRLLRNLWQKGTVPAPVIRRIQG